MYKDLKDIASEVKNELKAKYPAYKFSVTIQRFSGGQSMSVALMSGPQSPYIINPDRGMYTQLNHYYLDNYSEKYPYREEQRCYTVLTEEAIMMLKDVNKIANRENWDNSDTQTDYFDVNYYFDLNIGRWNKPYEIKQ